MLSALLSAAPFLGGLVVPPEARRGRKAAQGCWDWDLCGEGTGFAEPCSRLPPHLLMLGRAVLENWVVDRFQV